MMYNFWRFLFNIGQPTSKTCLYFTTTYIITIDLTQNLVLVAPVHAFNMWPMIRTRRYSITIYNFWFLVSSILMANRKPTSKTHLNYHNIYNNCFHLVGTKLGHLVDSRQHHGKHSICGQTMQLWVQRFLYTVFGFFYSEGKRTNNQHEKLTCIIW